MKETNTSVLRYGCLREAAKCRVDEYYGINNRGKSSEIIKVLDDVGAPNLGYLDSIVIHSKNIDRNPLAPVDATRVESEIDLLTDLILVFMEKRLYFSAILTINLVTDYYTALGRLANEIADQLDYKKKADNKIALKDRIIEGWENPATYALQWELNNAIRKEDYEEAVQIRDQINAKKRELTPLPDYLEAALEEAERSRGLERKL